MFPKNFTISGEGGGWWKSPQVNLRFVFQHFLLWLKQFHCEYFSTFKKEAIAYLEL